MDKGFTDAQMDIVVIQEDERRRKSQEIQEIVKSIQDLAEIMEDLRVLVLDQGTILDRIDFNLEQVEELTKVFLSFFLFIVTHSVFLLLCCPHFLVLIYSETKAFDCCWI